MSGFYIVYFKYILHFNFNVISGSTISPSSVAKLFLVSVYVKSIKQRRNEDLQKEYVKYRNKHNHLLRIAERKHYNDLLDEHKNDIKNPGEL